jgi:ATP-dependent DNA helicase RecG
MNDRAQEPPVAGTPIEQLAEVGETRAKQLHAMGIHTLADLLEYFPRDYQHESEEKAISALKAGEIGLARGEVLAVNYVVGARRPRFEATLGEGQERLALVFFNGAYLRRKIHPGLILRVRGEVALFHGIPQMANPKWQIVEAETPSVDESKYRPIYAASGKLSSEVIGKIISANLPKALENVKEWFSPAMLKRHGLLSRVEAYRKIHQPANQRDAVMARRRLVYDELMVMQLALGMSHRLATGRLSAPVMRIDKTLDARIRARFPFELTEAQTQAIWQIVADMKSGRPMKRLLQGDVGSGKTVVAVYAMLLAVANKMQGVLLAPTEVLAEQHFVTLSNLLRDSRVNIELLTSRTKRQSKGGALGRLAEGVAHLAVGTQALLQTNVELANLGLIVVDEQHRLGVEQRAGLSKKGVSPHYLVMTATPIPRTLALSYFADFDLTTIDSSPPGRQPIQTQWLRPSQSAKAYGLVKMEVSGGRQAYIVVPQIDGDEADDAKSVKKHLEELTKGPLAGLRLAALHGQMAPAEKQETMLSFRDGKIDVLVATTVIEVGIDVPNATVMVIEGAERFGLSQLHQLRGRVGRGNHPSYCVLISQPQNPAAEARLTAMINTSSGFEIAQMDLQLRGPGQFFGTRQHGLPEFKLADLKGETELLAEAKMDADEILAADPQLRQEIHADLRRAIWEQYGGKLELPRVG